MAHYQNQWLTRRLENIYRRLLCAYPASFRQRYGLEMEQVFRACGHDAYEIDGVIGYLRVWSHALCDLAINALLERLIELRKFSALKWRYFMTRTLYPDGHPFGERVAQVLEQEPAYYPLIVSVQPSQTINEVAESLLLDGDLEQPETTLTLFKELSENVQDAHVHDWLARLAIAAQHYYESAQPPETDNMAEQLLHHIYADTELFTLIAAQEVGYGLFDLVESLALEGTRDEIEEIMGLMNELAHRSSAI